MDPTVGQARAAGRSGSWPSGVVFGWTARTISRRIQDSGLRYRTRKGLTLAAYVAAAVFVSVVFSERFGSFTVAFGVAGAGIAFALQEVIASIGRLAGGVVRRLLPARRPRPARRHPRRRHRRRRPAHHAHGVRPVGERRPVQRAHRPGRQQLRVQGAGLQLLGRLPVPVGRDHAAGQVRQRLPPGARADAEGGRRGGRRLRAKRRDRPGEAVVQQVHDRGCRSCAPTVTLTGQSELDRVHAALRGRLQDAPHHQGPAVHADARGESTRSGGPRRHRRLDAQHREGRTARGAHRGRPPGRAGEARRGRLIGDGAEPRGRQ